jgi:hypothetical protein
MSNLQILLKLEYVVIEATFLVPVTFDVQIQSARLAGI